MRRKNPYYVTFVEKDPPYFKEDEWQVCFRMHNKMFEMVVEKFKTKTEALKYCTKLNESYNNKKEVD